MSYLDELNEAQRVAVEHTEGPVMVLAGAGSGKTRVLTYRIAHLIRQGVPPYQILSLTFTNKAAREMKSRIASIAGESQARSIWMGTFHSVFAKILRIESERIGYPSNFTIYDTEDSRRLLKEIIRDLNLDDKVYKPSLVHNRISAAKNNLMSPQAYAQSAVIQKEDTQSRKPQLAKIYEIYDKRLFKAGAMDFDDLLFKTNLLLRDFPEVLHKYQDKFRYILVDEYQDTNFSQYVIIRALAARFENICVVGDDAQSIYSFRGANIQNILNFQNDYPDVAVYKLEQNYRSTQNIVQAANSLIEKNIDQLRKEVWTENEEGNKLILMRAFSDNEEGMNVAHTIFSEKNAAQAHHKDFAILYRTNAQSRAMEDAMRKLNLPYRIYGGLSFYQRKEIKDLLAYFRLVANPQDEDALKRIINYPARGIGKTSMDRMILFANEHDVRLWDIVQNLSAYPIKISGSIANKVAEFAEMIRAFQVIAQKQNAYEAGKQIATTTGILKELYNDKTVEGISRYENVQELLNSMKEFVENTEEGPTGLGEFTADLPLLTDQDESDKEDEDKITLMTIHASKGLEFPYVFVVGLEENLFPSQLSMNSRADLEEERRLFYVAITRAEQRCFLSFSTSRYKYGNLEHTEPSRFLTEIDSKYIDASGTTGKAERSDFAFPEPGSSWGSTSGATRSRSTASGSTPRFTSQRRLKPLSKSQPASADFQGDDTSGLKSGMRVQHARFGTGTVMAIEGDAENRKATINFQQAGQKQILLRFAKLKIVES